MIISAFHNNILWSPIMVAYDTVWYSITCGMTKTGYVYLTY